MLRHLFIRSGGFALLLAVLALSTLTTSCGGGGSGDSRAARDMVLVEFLMVDRALNPIAPTGTKNLPRNAQILMVFSEHVDPQSVNAQTIQVRFGATGQSVPSGSFSVDGNTVRYDPTVTAQGQPNPFGFQPVTQYTLDIPNWEEQLEVVRNFDEDPNLQTFFTTFVTSDGHLRELVPPEIVRVYSIPDRFEVNPLTGQWPGNGVMAFEFSEPMAPVSFVLGGADGPDEHTTIDVRYLETPQINIDHFVAGLPIAGYFTHDAAATTYIFNPTFSFGSNKFIFASQIFQGLTDLSGNLLVNPRSYGPYTCDGTGRETGNELTEDFMSAGNRDSLATDADWGDTSEGLLQGQEITTRQQRVYCYNLIDQTSSDAWGEYFPITSPLVGYKLQTARPSTTPPTKDGRRVMWSFSDTEMGSGGSITGAGWGPDSNATFGAIYPNVILRCGFQKKNSINLSPSYSGNYEGNPTVVYQGGYQVAQAANIGNTDSLPGIGTPPAPQWTRNPCNASLAPLQQYTGFEPWPEFTTFFEWDEGDPLVENDRVFIFDASTQEGDTWQQLRGWFGFKVPCDIGLIGGYPGRRMYSTYEADSPDPQPSFTLGVLNPEPSFTDTSFTITKRVSTAQTLFYTDPNQSSGASSAWKTFGKNSDYRPIQFTPAAQIGGAYVLAEFQACDAVELDRRTINQAEPFLADWTDYQDDCDGYKCIRWRIHLVSNLISGTRASLNMVVLPVADAN